MSELDFEVQFNDTPLTIKTSVYVFQHEPIHSWLLFLCRHIHFISTSSICCIACRIHQTEL